MTTGPQKSGPMPIENSLDLLLVLLYAPGATKAVGEPISGITRLQKLVFLLNQGEGPMAVVRAAKSFLYQAYKMGPYSKQLYEDLNVLTSLGLIRITKLEYLITDDRDPKPLPITIDTEPDYILDSDSSAGSRQKVVESDRYSLTEKGMQIGADLFASLGRRDRDTLSEFKRFFNSIPLRQLLIFVYQTYPDFTTESEIRDQLGL